MRILHKLLLFFYIFYGVSTFANVSFNNFYVAGSAGILITKNLLSNQFGQISNLPPPVRINYKPGLNLSGLLGVKLTILRLEVEIAKRTSEFTTLRIKSQTIPLGGKTDVTVALMNVLLEMPGLIGVYVGGGLGLSNLRNNLKQGAIHIMKDDTMCYQGIIGLKIGISKYVNVFSDYKYLVTNKIKILNEPYRSHSINGGIMLSFG